MSEFRFFLWKAILAGALFLCLIPANGQRNYRSRYTDARGSDWTGSANWEVYNGSAWVIATEYPGQTLNNAATVTIRNFGAGGYYFLTRTLPYPIGDLVVGETGTGLGSLYLGGIYGYIVNLRVNNDINVNNGHLGMLELDGTYVHSLTIGGDLSVGPGGTFTLLGTTDDRMNITFNGTDHSISNAGVLQLYGITFANNGVVSVSGNIDMIRGEMSVGSNCTINPSATTFFNPMVEYGSITGTGKINVTRTVAVSNTYFYQYRFVTDNLSTLTVNYSGNGNQTVSGTASVGNYGNLETSSSGTKTLLSNVTVNGNIAIGAGTTLDAAAGSYYLSLGGNWVNNGTFTPRSGTVTFMGNTAQSVSGSSISAFYNLIIAASGPGTTVPPGGRVTVSNAVSTGDRLFIDSDGLTNSGSLVFTGSTTPFGRVTYYRTTPASLYRYISSPVSAPTLPSGPTYWRYDEPTDTWVEMTGCISGLGYTIAGTGTKISYTGSLVTTASLTCTAPYLTPYYQYRETWGGGGWNLLGNPFTSAMSTSQFLSLNASSLDPNYMAVYLYNGEDYYYSGFSIPGYTGLGPVSLFVQAGQGFFVLARYNNVVFNFSAATMQTHATSTQIFKSADPDPEPWPGLKLIVKYGDSETSTLVVYNELMSEGLDPGYDVGQLSTGPAVNIYTTLVETDNNVNFACQALPVVGSENRVIPVGIDSESGGEVTFSAFTVPLDGCKFWLEDRLTGTFTNISDKIYTVTLPGKTFGTGRFFIISSANTPTDTDQGIEGDMDGLRIWAYDGRVIVKGAVGIGSLCEVYDSGGAMVMTTRLEDNELNTVALPSTRKGVFFVRVIDGGRVTTGKVVLL